MYDHDPPAAVTVCSVVPPTRMLTVSPVPAEPLSCWVGELVMLSVLDTPRSLAASRSGTSSVVGAVWSTVSPSADEAPPALPAASVACTEIA